MFLKTYTILFLLGFIILLILILLLIKIVASLKEDIIISNIINSHSEINSPSKGYCYFLFLNFNNPNNISHIKEANKKYDDLYIFLEGPQWLINSMNNKIKLKKPILQDENGNLRKSLKIYSSPSYLKFRKEEYYFSNKKSGYYL